MKEKKKIEMSDEDKDIDVESDEVSKFLVVRLLRYCTARSDFKLW